MTPSSVLAMMASSEDFHNRRQPRLALLRPGDVAFQLEPLQPLAFGALALQSQLGFLELGDIETHAMNEPRFAALLAHKLGFTMEPDDAAVASDNPVNGFQGLASNESLGCLGTPARAVFGMDLLVPAHGIIQPLFLGEAERLLDMRTDVSFAQAAIKHRHEDDCRNLLDQHTVTGFQGGRSAFISDGWRRSAFAGHWRRAEGQLLEERSRQLPKCLVAIALGRGRSFEIQFRGGVLGVEAPRVAHVSSAIGEPEAGGSSRRRQLGILFIEPFVKERSARITRP